MFYGIFFGIWWYKLYTIENVVLCCFNQHEIPTSEALVEDGKSVEDDPVARDYAEGMFLGGLGI